MPLENFIRKITGMYQIKYVTQSIDKDITLPEYDEFVLITEQITQLYNCDTTFKELIDSGNIIGAKKYLDNLVSKYGDLQWIANYLKSDNYEAIKISFEETHNYHQTVILRKHLASEGISKGDPDKHRYINEYKQEAELLKDFYDDVMNNNFDRIHQLMRLWVIKNMLDMLGISADEKKRKNHK